MGIQQIFLMLLLLAMSSDSFAMVTDESMAADEFSSALKRNNIDISELKAHRIPKGLVAMQRRLKDLGLLEQDSREYIVTFRLGAILIHCRGITADRDLKQSTSLNECSAQTGKTSGVLELLN